MAVYRYILGFGSSHHSRSELEYRRSFEDPQRIHPPIQPQLTDLPINKSAHQPTVMTSSKMCRRAYLDTGPNQEVLERDTASRKIPRLPLLSQKATAKANIHYNPAQQTKPLPHSSLLVQTPQNASATQQRL